MKKLLSIALVGLLAGAAVGCGPKAQTTPTGGGTDSAGGTTTPPPAGGDTGTAPGAPPAQ